MKMGKLPELKLASTNTQLMLNAEAAFHYFNETLDHY